jgi:hypothetical protein
MAESVGGTASFTAAKKAPNKKQPDGSGGNQKENYHSRQSPLLLFKIG